MHLPADAVPAVVGKHPVPRAAREQPDGGTDVSQPVSRPCGRNAVRESGFGGLDECHIRRVRRSHDEAHGGVPAPAGEPGATVDADEVTVAESILARNAVYHSIVHARADDPPGKRAGRQFG